MVDVNIAKMKNQAKNQATVRRNVDPNVLSAFWTIAETSKEKRLSGIEWLVNHLSSKDAEVTADESKKGPPSKEMDYVLKRLLKGLASNRDCARLGYSTALTEILRRCGKSLFALKDLMDMIEDALPIVSADSKKEISAAKLGRAMAYLCIVQSDFILHSTNNELVKFITAVVALRQKISISVLCCTVLQQIINKVDKAVVVEHVLPLIETDLSRGWEKSDADLLLLLISARKRKIVDKKFLSSHWNCKKIVSVSNMKFLGQAMANAATQYSAAHPLCYVVLKEAAEDEETFGAFWSTAVYDCVFSSTESKIKKLMCLQMVVEGLRNVTKPEQVGSVLSPSLLSYIIRSLTNKGQPLHEESKKLAGDIVEFVKTCSSGEIQVAILNVLLQSPGSVQFDSMTKTRTVSSIIPALNGDGCRVFSDQLKKLIVGVEEASSGVAGDDQTPHTDGASRRVWAAGCLSSLLTHPAVLSDQQWQLSLLKFFFLTAFFTVRKPVPSVLHCDKAAGTTTGVDPDLRIASRDSLLRCLNKMSTHKTSGKNKSTNEHLLFVSQLGELLQYCSSLLEHPNRISVVNKMTSEERDRWTSVLRLIAEIECEDKEKSREEKLIEGETSNKRIAFKLLLSFEALQMFIETCKLSAGAVTQTAAAVSSSTAADDVIQELETCYRKSLVTKKKRKDKRKSGDVNEEEPHWADVLLDLMMSLMSEESHLVRSVVNVVFSLICPYVSTAAIKLITDVIKPSSATDNPVSFEDEDEEMLEDDDDVSGADATMDEKDDGAGIKKNPSNGDVSSSDDDDDDGSDEDDNEENLEVDEGIRSAVKAALGNAASKQMDEESGDSADESDLDDDAMFKLDDMLAAAFKGMKRGGKASKAEREQKQRQLLHYRMRCLDLVEVLVQHGTNNLLLLDLMLPLLELMEQGHLVKKEKQISDRATRIFRSLCQHKKMLTDSSVTKEFCVERLSELIKKSASVAESAAALQKDIANGCCILLRLAFGEKSVGEGDTQTKWKKILEIPEAHEILAVAVKDFCEKRNNGVSHIFLHQLFEKLPVLLWPLTPQVLFYVTSQETKVFCRTQLCTVLTSMINKKVVQDIGLQEWTVFAKTVLSTISKYVVECVREEEVKPKLLEELLRLVSRVLSTTTEPAIIEESVDGGFIDKLSELKPVNKEVKKLTNNIESTIRPRLSSAGGSAKKDKQEKKEKKRKAKKQKISDSKEEKTNGDKDRGGAVKRNGSAVAESESDESMTEVVVPAAKKRKR